MQLAELRAWSRFLRGKKLANALRPQLQALCFLNFIENKMAFLVVYKNKENSIDWSNKATYLDQDFYAELCNLKPQISTESILSKMSLLDYGDELILKKFDLKTLMDELSNINHLQIQAFKSVIEYSLEKDIELAISGDMHPVLK